MSILDKDLEVPPYRIVQRTGATWLGRAEIHLSSFSGSPAPGKIQALVQVLFQRSLLTDENTLRRVVAHEMCHVAEYWHVVVPYAEQHGVRTVVMMQRLTGDHGKAWQKEAAKINAVYGNDFVTEKSDQSYNVDAYRHEAWLLLDRPSAQEIYIATMIRPTPKAITAAWRRLIMHPRSGRFIKTDLIDITMLQKVTSWKWSVVDSQDKDFATLNALYDVSTADASARILVDLANQYGVLLPNERSTATTASLLRRQAWQYGPLNDPPNSGNPQDGEGSNAWALVPRGRTDQEETLQLQKLAPELFHDSNNSVGADAWIAADQESLLERNPAHGNRHVIQGAKKWEPWLGVDLDGCLAKELKPFNPLKIGPPILAMVRKIKQALERGITVKIFTARLADTDKATAISRLIRAWTKRYIGVPLDATNKKDPGMMELWDDRARQVEKNIGKFAEDAKTALAANAIPPSLQGLAAEARKAPSFEEFERDYTHQIKHGTYFHFTTDPNFIIDSKKGPRDMGSMVNGGMSPGKLMVTSHFDYWDEYYNKSNRGVTRPYVAIIDMSDVPRDAYHQVNRGFGNEFWVEDPSKAKVVAVMPVAKARALDKRRSNKIPQSEQELREFYERATGKQAAIETALLSRLVTVQSTGAALSRRMQGAEFVGLKYKDGPVHHVGLEKDGKYYDVRGEMDGGEFNYGSDQDDETVPMTREEVMTEGEFGSWIRHEDEFDETTEMKEAEKAVSRAFSKSKQAASDAAMCAHVGRATHTPECAHKLIETLKQTVTEADFKVIGSVGAGGTSENDIDILVAIHPDAKFEDDRAWTESSGLVDAMKLMGFDYAGYSDFSLDESTQKSEDSGKYLDPSGSSVETFFNPTTHHTVEFWFTESSMPKEAEKALNIAQKSAAERKAKKTIEWRGLSILIEYEPGDTRTGKDKNGQSWEQKMQASYGRIGGVKGTDGEGVDVYLGDTLDAPYVYVVEQNDPDTGDFDESKVMIGWQSLEDAEQAYLVHYPADWLQKGVRRIYEAPADEFAQACKDRARSNEGKIAKNQLVGDVYLLHFNQPYQHARHYLGWAEDAERRIEEHRNGKGSRLMQVVRNAGIDFRVAKIWHNQSREFERRLKNQGGLSRQCPICQAEGTDRDTIRQHQLEKTVAPKTPTTGPDYAEITAPATLTASLEGRLLETLVKTGAAIKCPKCDYTGSFKTTLQGEPVCECPKCENKFVPPFSSKKTTAASKQIGPVYYGTYHQWTDDIPNNIKYGVGRFFSSDPLVAQAYGSFVYEAYLTMHKPFVVDAENNSYYSIPKPAAMKNWFVGDEVDTDSIAQYAYKHGYDGVIIKNVIELHHPVVANDYIVFNANQIKVKGIIEPEISIFTANKYHRQELQRRLKRESDAKTAAPLHDDAKAKWYYHGTDSEAAAQAIFREGLKGRSTQSRAMQAPLKNRVYLSTDFGEAAIYALGGMMFGTKNEGFLKDKDPYGYVFAVQGANLNGDIVPDEDSVGEAIDSIVAYDKTRERIKKIETTQERWKGEKETLARQLQAIKNAPITRAPLAVRDNLMYIYYHRLTTTQRNRLAEAAIQAQAGKRAQKWLAPDTARWLLDNGAHVAHLGPVWPNKTWRIDKRKAVMNGGPLENWATEIELPPLASDGEGKVAAVKKPEELNFESLQFPLTLYRTIIVPKGDLSDVRWDWGIGLYWSIDEEHAKAYWPENDEDDACITLMAKVPKSSVDWEATATSQTHALAQEFNLKAGAQIEIVGYKVGDAITGTRLDDRWMKVPPKYRHVKASAPLFPKIADHFNQDGYWVGESNAASGVLPICSSTGRICLAWRSGTVHHGNCWGVLGGAIQAGMSPSDSAKKELAEETGYTGSVKLEKSFVFQDGEFRYFNFLGIVPSEFGLHPQNEEFARETKRLWWATLDEIQTQMEKTPESFHFGFRELFKKADEQIRQASKLDSKTAAGDPYLVHGDPIMMADEREAAMLNKLATPEAKTAAPRSIWYHGSSIKNLRSILAQGLIPEPKNKNWADDPGATITSPSRESYGGIYVTHNLLTAIGAPRDHYEEGREIIVCMELQPNTFFLDEDRVTGFLDRVFPHGNDNTWIAATTWLYLTKPGNESELERLRDAYVDRIIEQLNYAFKQRGQSIHPSLEKRLRTVIGDCFVPALGRKAAHAIQHESDYEYKKFYTHVFGDATWNSVPPKPGPFWTVQEGESRFREAADKVTRSLRALAVPSDNETSIMMTARVNMPIGYKGRNRILAVVEVIDGSKYLKASNNIVKMILHYGSIPEDFWEQWRQRMGYKVDLQRPRQDQGSSSSPSG